MYHLLKLSSSGFEVHNPNLVDSNSLIYYLHNTYMNKFGISYMNRKSFWSVPEMTLLPEKELINTLSIHSYDTNWIQEDIYNIRTVKPLFQRIYCTNTKIR